LKVLVTRPEPGAAATAARLLDLGHEPVAAPCLVISPRKLALPVAPAAVIVTSLQAIPALPDTLRDVPVFCVGDATAGRLRAAGFGRVESAAGDARDLIRLVSARRRPGTYLLATGARQGLALARQLRADGFIVLRRSVYNARPVRALAPGVLAALAGQQIGAALFFSAETAQAFCRLKPPGTANVAAYALSAAVADGLRSVPWRAIHTAMAPTEADLLALLA